MKIIVKVEKIRPDGTIVLSLGNKTAILNPSVCPGHYAIEKLGEMVADEIGIDWNKYEENRGKYEN